MGLQAVFKKCAANFSGKTSAAPSALGGLNLRRGFNVGAAASKLRCRVRLARKRSVVRTNNRSGLHPLDSANHTRLGGR